jgi:hypothetical protein
MGYYSDFYVDKTDIPFIHDLLNGVSSYTWDKDTRALHGVKWYAWLTDLETVAKLFPTSYLRIIRYGEDSPDISAAVVTDGKVKEVKPELVWPE